MWPTIPQILWFFTENVATSAQRLGARFSGAHLVEWQISNEELSAQWAGATLSGLWWSFGVPVLNDLWFLHSIPSRTIVPCRPSPIGCVEFRLVHTQLSPQPGPGGDLPCRSRGPHGCAVCSCCRSWPTHSSYLGHHELRLQPPQHWDLGSALTVPPPPPRAVDRAAADTAPIQAFPSPHSSALPVVCAGWQLPPAFCPVPEFFRTGWQVSSSSSDWVWSESPLINPYFPCRYEGWSLGPNRGRELGLTAHFPLALGACTQEVGSSNML